SPVNQLASWPLYSLSPLRERRFARGFELIARNPLRHFVGVRDVEADPEAELSVFDHAVEVPTVVDLVRGLVIALTLVFFVLLLAPSFGLADEVRAGVQI